MIQRNKTSHKILKFLKDNRIGKAKFLYSFNPFKDRDGHTITYLFRKNYIKEVPELGKGFYTITDKGLEAVKKWGNKPICNHTKPLKSTRWGYSVCPDCNEMLTRK